MRTGNLFLCHTPEFQRLMRMSYREMRANLAYVDQVLEREYEHLLAQWQEGERQYHDDMKKPGNDVESKESGASPLLDLLSERGVEKVSIQRTFTEPQPEASQPGEGRQ